MATDPLNEILHMRIATAEKKMLSKLAEREALKPSQVVRRLIRQAYEREFKAKR
jgi:hypothetical protein